MARIHYWELSNYNSGRLIGRWFDLDGLNHSEHMAEVKNWLNGLTEKTGEICEEYIVGDSEDIPDKYIGEYSINSDYFDYMAALELSNLDRDVFEAGIECGIDPEYVAQYYYGYFSTKDSFGREILEGSGDLNDVPEYLQDYIDFDAYARDLLYNSFCEHKGHYFNVG